MRLILICTRGSVRASGHPHRVLRVLDSEHGRLAHLVVDRVRRVHRLGDRQAQAGEAIPGGVEFEQRILSLHVATWHIFERGRDRCETKWTEVRDAVAAFVD